MSSDTGTQTNDDGNDSNLTLSEIHSLYRPVGCCRHKPKHVSALLIALDRTTLDKKDIIKLKLRIEPLLREYSNRSLRYAWSFHCLRFVMTVGSLIVPALLSIQYNVTTSAANLDQEVYWTVWILSLLVTISNGILQYMKVDKKYYTLNSIFQVLVTETWRYIHLTGRYSGSNYDPPLEPSHKNMLQTYCDYIEKVRMKHIVDEYYRFDEKDQKQIANTQASSAGPKDSDYGPSFKSKEEVNGTETAGALTTVPRNAQAQQKAPGPGSGQGARAPRIPY